MGLWGKPQIHKQRHSQRAAGPPPTPYLQSLNLSPTSQPMLRTPSPPLVLLGRQWRPIREEKEGVGARCIQIGTPHRLVLLGRLGRPTWEETLVSGSEGKIPLPLPRLIVPLTCVGCGTRPTLQLWLLTHSSRGRLGGKCGGETQSYL